MIKTYRNRPLPLLWLFLLSCPLIYSCQHDTKVTNNTKSLKQKTDSYYGTLEPFASEAVYFLMTDRFVDGDPSNNHAEQGGPYPTFRRPIVSKDGRKAYVGYMGGDFKGILDNADYIKEMGFTSIWLTPIVDQPDEAFSGGEPIEFGGAFKDGGKTGYHGYWGANFFQVDEHLPSKNLSFKQLTSKLRQDFGIKTVLDVVLNHGSPAFSMPVQQRKYGQIYDQDNELVADHHNLEPINLDYNNPLQYFYNKKTEIVQLSDINENNPATLEYFTNAYLRWIDQGADAFRIDTIKHMPHQFWKSFSDNIREQYPNFFMFAESYSFDANFIAEHTLLKNGGISVLDFPGRKSMIKVFENPSSSYSDITSYLHLENGPYYNPYELMIFYDNHDMSRMNASDAGFIDAHNWLFTSRGIPVVYYGSEIGFMAGTKEHEGNRNYFGESLILSNKDNIIRKNLNRIANIRKNSIALQKGLQINLKFEQQTAAFIRVYEHNGINQTALVLLNKGNVDVDFSIDQYLTSGEWIDATNHKVAYIGSNKSLKDRLKPHQVKVLLFNQKTTNTGLIKVMNNLMLQSDTKK